MYMYHLPGLPVLKFLKFCVLLTPNRLVSICRSKGVVKPRYVNFLF